MENERAVGSDFILHFCKVPKKLILSFILQASHWCLKNYFEKALNEIALRFNFPFTSLIAMSGFIVYMGHI